MFFALSFILLSGGAFALPELPSAPLDPAHPGSKVYPFSFNEQKLTCLGRDVVLFLPILPASTMDRIPVVVYGHGQALELENYRGTLEHLARKGVASVFHRYDKGFFDQDWERMGRDYVNVAACALESIQEIVNLDQVVFSGHSKGAYVASMAAGIAFKENLKLKPQALIIFNPAGADAEIIKEIAPTTAVTVVYSDQDTVVKRSISETIYQNARSERKQFIFVRSYLGITSTDLKAGHFWALTKKSVFGGGAESALHYYGSWKWLTAGALDLGSSERFEDPYLYGNLAAEKGLPNFTDQIFRNW